MPKQHVPSYRLHRQSGQAIVTLTDSRTGRRRDVLLGVHDSPESRALYGATIAAWEKAGRVLDMPASEARATIKPPEGVVTICTVAVAYTEHMDARYTDRRNRDRLFHIRATLKLWRSLYGRLPAREFGPLALRKLRDAMIGEGWSRSLVNDRVRIVQSAIEHGVSIELVRPEVLTALRSVRPLRRGEGGSEGKRVVPAPEADINAVQEHVAPQVWALIQLQLLTGARAGELVIMRLVDIDTTGSVWLFRPQFHKRDDDAGRERTIFLGPRAQEVIAPFMKRRRIDAYLFSPREANAVRKKLNAKGQRRPGQKPNLCKTDRRTGDRYTTGSYRKAITRACEAAGVDVWTPHRLRHNAATTLRREAGLEAASLVLGHSSTTLTDAVYAERDMAKAVDIIAKVG